MAFVTSSSPLQIPPQRQVVLLAGVGIFFCALYIFLNFTSQKTVLLLLGSAFGLVLYHASFGFAAGWRALILQRRGAGMRAQMLMLTVASLIFLPLLDAGSIFDMRVGGAIAPVGLSVVVGAAVFGLGMQLAGGCASGTLYTVGGGSLRMVVTLFFFVAGSVIGSAHLPWWLEAPSLGSISLLDTLGLGGALITQLAVFAAIAYGTLRLERSYYGNDGDQTRPDSMSKMPSVRRFTYGPWPLIWGAVALALLNAATLVTSGHPWSISFGYALWGAKALSALGVDMSATEFWTWPYPAKALSGSLFSEDTSVMNMGIILGAALAAGLSGKFGSSNAVRVPLRSLLAAGLGGIMMGYGARLGFGCNVGAYFSGIASGSLHGWLWLVAGFAGSFIGVKLRPRFGLG